MIIFLCLDQCSYSVRSVSPGGSYLAHEMYRKKVNFIFLPSGSSDRIGVRKYALKLNSRDPDFGNAW